VGAVRDCAAADYYYYYYYYYLRSPGTPRRLCPASAPTTTTTNASLRYEAYGNTSGGTTSTSVPAWFTRATAEASPDVLHSSLREALHERHGLIAQIGKLKADLLRCSSGGNGDEDEASTRKAPAEGLSLPPGFVLWYHSQALPSIFALSAPSRSEVLLAPHPDAPSVRPSLPLGMAVVPDGEAVRVALLANPRLKTQHDALVGAGRIDSAAFWTHFFTHVHALKMDIARKAWARADGAAPQVVGTG